MKSSLVLIADRNGLHFTENRILGLISSIYFNDDITYLPTMCNFAIEFYHHYMHKILSCNNNTSCYCPKLLPT